jgi:hypothetical protein
VLLLKLNIGCERFCLCRLFTIDWYKPEIVTVQYNSRAVGVASEARIDKIAKNIEFLILKEMQFKNII